MEVSQLDFESIKTQATYCLLDAASMEDAFSKLYEPSIGAVSLYKGRSEEELAEVAPYLVECMHNVEFNSWLFENGWGKSWGVLMVSSASLDELHKHFRKFLIVQTEGGEELYFRFYDPRVLRIFLPTCSRAQLIELFGPVKKYICEAEDPTSALSFSLADGYLKVETINLLHEKLPQILQVEEDIPSINISEDFDENVIV